MIKRKLFLVAFLSVALAGCVSAGQHAVYLAPEQTAVYTQFPAAPALNSPVDRADRAVMHEWQNKRTAEQCALARSQAYAQFDEFFYDISPFQKPTPMFVTDFMTHVQHDADIAVSSIKKREHRPRPFLTDSTLEPCLGRINGFSYPSGHSTMSHLDALILSDLVPARRAQFMSRADACALNRVIGGVHNPSDIAAGKDLAELVYRQLKESKKFRDDMEKLRSYLSR